MFIFAVAGVIGMIGRVLCMRPNGDYQELQPELFAPDVIDIVLADESLGQIYVCYDDASYVNVYTYSGEFLWAVSTPYMRNVYFDLTDGQLIVYDSYSAYIYASSDGTFIRKANSDELELQYDDHHDRTDTFRPGEIYFDIYEVYRAEEDGSLTTLVARPWWYMIFNFAFCCFVSTLCALGYGMTLLADKFTAYQKVRKDHPSSKGKDIVKHPKAKFYLKYNQITSVAHLVYAVCNVICGIWFDGILCLGFIPLALHFVLSFARIAIMRNGLNLREGEKAVLDYWSYFEAATFIVAAISVAVVSMLVSST